MVLAIQIHPTCFSTAHQFDISILNIPQIWSSLFKWDIIILNNAVVPTCARSISCRKLYLSSLYPPPPSQLANPEVRSADQELIKDEPICILAGICNSAEYGAARGAWVRREWHEMKIGKIVKVKQEVLRKLLLLLLLFLLLDTRGVT
jgi:hypothetical protein